MHLYTIERNKQLKNKNKMKNFKITNSEKNLAWVNNNLDAVDFKIDGNEIVIFYYNEMQKNDILEAITND